MPKPRSKYEKQPLNREADIWLRQELESDQAWEAFAAYRDMGLSRSVTEVSKKLNKSPQLLRRWSSVWQWAERVRAWDAFLDAEAREVHISSIRDMNERQATLGRSMQAVGGHVVKKLMDRIASGEKPAITLVEARKLIAEGAKLERLVMGQPTDIDLDLGDLTDKQLAALSKGHDPRTALAQADDPEPEEAPAEDAE